MKKSFALSPFLRTFAPRNRMTLMNFRLTSKYQPTGDQPEAISERVAGVERGDRAQVLLLRVRDVIRADPPAKRNRHRKRPQSLL